MARPVCAAMLLWVGMAMRTAALGQSGAAHPQGATIRDQITQHEEQLASARAAHQGRDVVTELNTLCSLYRQSGEMVRALDDCNLALQIEQSAGSRMAVALTQGIIGRIYSDEGQEQKALELFEQTLPVWRELGSRTGEANTLNNLGRTYSNLAREDEAMQALNQALPMWRAAGNRPGEASTLDNMGKVYTDTSQGAKAVDVLSQALAIWRPIGERSGEALSLGNLGKAYSDLGQKQKALEAYNQSLAIWREVGNKQGEASALNNLGRAHSDLGEKETALDWFNQALPVWRESGNRNGEALDLNDIGRAYADMKQPEQAVDFYNQALIIWRTVNNRRGEAMTLSNMGRAYLDLGSGDKALAIDLESLPIWREVKETRGEALALALIGMAYAKLGQPQTALPYTLAALLMAKTAGDPDLQGWIDTSMMVGFANQHRPEVAIFFGLDAVNSFQQIRKNISGLDKDLQAGFAQTRAGTYRSLAELLVETGRLGEAEQVLDLLKEQELKDVVRGAAPPAGSTLTQLTLSTTQEKVQGELKTQEEKTRALEDLDLEYAGLQSKPARTPAEDARMGELDSKIQQGIAEVVSYFAGTICRELERQSGGNGDAQKTDAAVHSYLQDTLARLGPRVMGIRILLGLHHAYAIVVTPGARKKFDLEATPAAIRAKALEVRESLAEHKSYPNPVLEQLYAMVVAPVESELKTIESPATGQSGTPILLWSLDDALRYVPMAALYDGRQYMVERFRNVLFTPDSYGHMADLPMADGTKPHVLAMGLSKSYGGLPALPGVTSELDAVVHDPAVPESNGPMDGRLLRNDGFTLAAVKTELGSADGFAVVHIASHFVVESGSGGEPFLMLGGEDAGDARGYAWNLSEMEQSPIEFHGTRLLTLSACSTGRDYTTRDGTEMDSLGMVAQQKEAEAVLATLWDVEDESTTRLMSDFYSRWLKDPPAGKAEALRQAQLALLKGAAASPGERARRGLEVVVEPAASSSNSSYAHPFYWAPFVLIGNFN